jgi:hypothetical protein
MITGPGWVARNQQFEEETYSLERLTGAEFGVELIQWSGM